MRLTGSLSDGECKYESNSVTEGYLQALNLLYHRLQSSPFLETVTLARLQYHIQRCDSIHQ